MHSSVRTHRGPLQLDPLQIDTDDPQAHNILAPIDSERVGGVLLFDMVGSMFVYVP
jgi:hypothetical protein